jgi:tRNA threonylcarbamoyladenosine biosynthesis protein TsaB
MKGGLLLNILLLDASTSAEIISVKKDNIFFDSSEISAISHSKTIFTRIDSCLKKAGISIKDIGLIAVGAGPGSFTGIRIAVTTARMLAQVLGIKVVRISSQLIFALSIDSKEGDYLMPAFDAKKGRVFGALFLNKNSSLEEIIKPGDYFITKLLDKIPRGLNAICAGDGCIKFRDVIEKHSNRIVIHENFLPSGIHTLKYLADLYDNGKLDILDYDKIVPDYTRISDAEVVRSGFKPDLTT